MKNFNIHYGSHRWIGISYVINLKYKGSAEYYTGFAAPRQFADLGFMYG